MVRARETELGVAVKDGVVTLTGWVALMPAAVRIWSATLPLEALAHGLGLGQRPTPASSSFARSTAVADRVGTHQYGNGDSTP
jgi:hypothetical protein